MSWEVRPCSSADELRAAMGPIWHYFGRSTPTDDQFERVARVLPAERMHAAWERGRAVGGAGAFPFELTVPGGRVPAAGVSVVGVLPTHRRRGILKAMMRAQLDACHARGEPVACLWATEDTIYGRFGYGIASFTGEIELPRERSAYATPFEPSGEARIVSLEGAERLVAPVYERIAAETPGMFHRTSAWWQARALADPEWRRRGGGELQCVIVVLRDAMDSRHPAPERKPWRGDLVSALPQGELPAGTWEHPSLGPLSLKELIVYHRLHVMDHVQQIATIKADPGYPAD